MAEQGVDIDHSVGCMLWRVKWSSRRCICAKEQVWRDRSTHDVTLDEGRSTPCFCWADHNHPLGQELKAAVDPERAEDPR